MFLKNYWRHRVKTLLYSSAVSQVCFISDIKTVLQYNLGLYAKTSKIPRPVHFIGRLGKTKMLFKDTYLI